MSNDDETLYQQYLAILDRISVEIRTSQRPRTVLEQHGNPDVLYRVAETRAETFFPRDELESAKISASWIDGYVCAFRSTPEPAGQDTTN